MEKTYNEYNAQIDGGLDGLGIRELAGTIRPLGKFTYSSERVWQPVRYSGFSLITPPGAAETVNRDSVTHLADSQQRLLQYLNPRRFVAAPVSAFHVTVARLISGSLFDERLRGTGEADFLNDFRQVLAGFPEYRQVPMQIKGITIFSGGILAASLSAVDEASYWRLLAFRQQIYENPVLQNYGVEPKPNFTAHISLAYLEASLREAEREQLAELIAAVNREFFQTPLPMAIARVEVRRFDHFLKFNREAGWPVFEFTR